MIDMEQVSQWYGAFEVLTACTTTVRKGEVVVVVVVVCGPSGSGKSTLIKCVNALEPIQKGQIRVDGTHVAGPKININRLRARVSMVLQHFELFPHLTHDHDVRDARDGLCAQGGRPRDLHGPRPDHRGLREGRVLRQPRPAQRPRAAVPVEDPGALTGGQPPAGSPAA